MKLLIIIISCVVLSGCYCNIQVNESSLHSFKKIEYGFEISKLTVDSFSENNIPFKFTRDTTITCDPYCYKFANEQEFKAIYGQNSEFIDTCNFKPKKTIYFNKPNSDYEWSIFVPFEPAKSFDVLPLKFSKGNWYEIKNICGPYQYIYIYINQNSKWRIEKVEKW